MSPNYFNWPPFKLVRLDADTGKPLDPNVGMRVYREFYDLKKDKHGKQMVVAHKGKDKSGNKEGNAKPQETKNDNDSDKKGSGGACDGSGKKPNQGAQKRELGNEAEKPATRIDWTPEQDAKIKAMKEEGKSWADIADEVGGTKGLVKNRFGQLKKEEAGEGRKKDGAPQGESKENDGGKKKQENKKEKHDKKPEAAKAPAKAPSKAPSEAASRARDNGQARFTMGEWRTLQEDDMFSFGELQCLSELAIRDEQQQWLRIASAFADKTGRRVHPDDIRDKFAEMGGMGSAR